MTELPRNLTVIWHKTGISLAEIIKITRHPDGWLSGNHVLLDQIIDYDKQIQEQKFRDMFLRAVGLAIQNPTLGYQFRRYDHEDYMPDNANNASFSSNKPYKRMNYLDYKWKQPLGGRIPSKI